MSYNYIRKSFRHNGKLYSVYGKTEEEAIRKKLLLQQQLEHEQRASGGNMTVDSWFIQWKNTYKVPAGLTEKSLGMYDEKYSCHIQPYIGSKRLKDVSETDLQSILNRLAGKSQSTVSKVRLVLTQMFSRARKLRLIPFDPSEELSLPHTEDKSRRSLTEEERALFLKVEPAVPGAEIFFTMLYTGMRPGELMALTWADVDFAKNEIHVDKAIESGSYGKVKSTKTAAGVRMIPMRDALRQRLEPLRGEPSAPVFTNQAGNPHNITTFRRLWKSTLRAMDIAAGAEVYRNQITKSRLADDLVPYCLRHTFCTDLQNSGVPINVAKELMGHSDISTTANIYTHRDEKTLHANIARMDRPKKAVVKPRRIAKR